MWKLVQGYEKTNFIKECLNDEYIGKTIYAVDTTTNSECVYSLVEVSIDDFLNDNYVLLIKQ